MHTGQAAQQQCHVHHPPALYEKYLYLPVCRLCLQAKLSKSNAVCTTGLLYNELSKEKSYT
jgi:hypothetical protein